MGHAGGASSRALEPGSAVGAGVSGCLLSREPWPRLTSWHELMGGRTDGGSSPQWVRPASSPAQRQAKQPPLCPCLLNPASTATAGACQPASQQWRESAMLWSLFVRDVCPWLVCPHQHPPRRQPGRGQWACVVAESGRVCMWGNVDWQLRGRVGCVAWACACAVGAPAPDVMCARPRGPPQPARPVWRGVA